MKPWFVIVNTVTSMTASQSTMGLIERAVRRGIPTFVVPATGIDTLPTGELRAWAHPVVLKEGTKSTLVALKTSAPTSQSLADAGLVWIRVNPGRSKPAVHALLLEQLVALEAQGVPVLNSPLGLMVSRSKLYLSRFPQHARPPTLVTRNARSARSFVHSLDGPAVIKPAIGTRGQDVFVVRGADDPNFNQICDVVFRSGLALVQGFVPEATGGDTRVLLVNGKLLEQDGHLCAVRRVPSGSDFRSNVHVGGQPQPAKVTPELRALVDAVGPILRQDGLFLVGLDVIGNVVVEANVFAPGGFADAELFSGIDFLETVLDEATQAARD